MKNKGQAWIEFIQIYGWAILIIIVVIGVLFAMGVFKVQPYADFKEGCKTLCKESGLEFKSWHNEGGCIACDCEKVIPISCSD